MKGTMLFLLIVHAKCETPVVELADGKVAGTFDHSANGQKFIAFMGIPYASPPVGKFRFQNAGPPSPWNGTYDATKVPNTCLQFQIFTLTLTGVEDCLQISVFTQELPTSPFNSSSTVKLKPVIVYIHGGAFTYSAGHEHGPQNIIDKDVVFVNFNYRTGLLGFLSTEDDIIPGNNGLKDQVLALKWVKKNIAAFGGDPNKVTIAGMSAGGASVHLHLLSPLSRGLFHYAISMSGTALSPWAQADNARAKAFAIGEKLGCNISNSSSLLECLQQKPAESIVASTSSFMPWLTLPFSPFGPVVEHFAKDAFVSMQPIKIMEEGSQLDVPWLISYTSSEGLYPGAEIICDEEKFTFLNKNWTTIAKYLLDYEFTNPCSSNEVEKKILSEYSSNGLNFTALEIVNMLSDRHFIGSVVQAGLVQARKQVTPIYAYEFEYRGAYSASDMFCRKKNYGASHIDDLGYVAKLEHMPVNETEMDIAMKNAMIDLWGSFSESGKPSWKNLQHWPSLQENLPSFTFLKIKKPDVVEVLNRDNLGNTNFWNSLGLQENQPDLSHKYKGSCH